MGFNIFKRKDPICGMKEEKGKGTTDNSKNWFCSESCKKEYKKKISQHGKESKKVKSCCH
ncbi:hypothetical protein HOI26_03995 [Candidatus Woesearchaeota archaeon]|jgi:YHS domain-containing protein|nr:hypothetical protein [Candidatus Woesearchaeota archaeon]MBT5740238.1 hypothetical protein [Candidatus Woesearchaeota archaeon]